MRVARGDNYHITRPRTHVLGNGCIVYANDCVLDGDHGTIHGERAIINGAGWRIMPSARATATINNASYIIVGDAPSEPLAAPTDAPAVAPRSCAACNAAPVGAILIPCNHAAVCAPCAATITTSDNPACPRCHARAPRWRPFFL